MGANVAVTGVNPEAGVLRLITLGRLQLLRDGPPSESLHLQPKRLALLAYLALTARDGSQQRDTVLALFWPRADRTHARRCLRQSLFHLRNELGDGVILNHGRDGLAIAPDRLWCDAAAVERALRGKRAREALELHRGDFLPGLFVDRDSGALDDWVERTRQRLRAAVVAAAWDLAEADADAGRLALALEVAFCARMLAPDDERALRRHAALLARAGDVAAALGACAEFRRRLRREYEAEPSAETVSLARALREGRPVSAGTGMVPAPVESAVEATGTAEEHAMTQLAERAEHAARPSTRAASPPVRVRRVALAVSAFTALVLAGPARRAAAGPDESRLMLAEFTNRTRDSLLGLTVTEVVRRALSEVARVDVASLRAVRLPSAEARVAAPVRIVVTGEVVPRGAGFAVSARLVSTDDGRVLGVVEEQAADSSALLPTVRRLSLRLQGNVRETFEPSRSSFGRRMTGWLTRAPLDAGSTGPHR